MAWFRAALEKKTENGITVKYITVQADSLIEAERKLKKVAERHGYRLIFVKPRNKIIRVQEVEEWLLNN